MKKNQTPKPQTAKGFPAREQEINPVGNTMSTHSKWSAVQRVRLPHKVGLPLGSGGGGDHIDR